MASKCRGIVVISMASGRTWCPTGSSRKNKTKINKIEQNVLPIRDHPYVKGFAAESHGTLAGHLNVEDNFPYQASSTQARTEIPRERGYAALPHWISGNTQPPLTNHRE